MESNLQILPNQSCFMPDDPSVYQLILNTYEIYVFFDSIPPLEVRGIFLDISKAFDRVFLISILCK